MAGETTYTVRLADGREFGPAAMDLVVTWAREGRVPANAMLVETGGAARPVTDVAPIVRILNAPPMTRSPAPPASKAPLSGLIPYKNPLALVGYYLAVFSLVPGIGILLGPTAVVCGIAGFTTGLKNPESRGKVHAWVAIVLGLATTAGNLYLLYRLGNPR